MNPVGPEEPSVYWRRRAAVGVALLVVIWFAWWLVQAAFGDSGEPTAQEPSASPSFGLSMSPSADPGPSATEPSASLAPSVSASPSPSATAATCKDSNIAVSASTASSSTGVGEGLALTMSVTNTGSAACSRDVGAGANEMRITSGSVLVWSSDFCNTSSAKDKEQLDAGEAFTTSVTWPGTVTEKGCPDNQPLGQPGTYNVVARNGSVESEPVTFTVK